MRLSPITRRRIRRFLTIKRSVFALAVLGVLYVLSLGSELIANDRPLLVIYKGVPYPFCAYVFHSDKTFGGRYDTAADYREIAKTPAFAPGSGNRIIFPLVPYSAYTSSLNELKGNPPTPPDAIHILGTDDRGRDVFARLLYGFRTSITFALVLLVLEIVIGVLIGALQGYLGGVHDLVMQRLIEIFSALPFLYVVILVGNVLGQSFGMLIIIMAVFNWIGLSYYIRAEFLKNKQFQFVEAARALGVRGSKILFSEILPNALTPVVTFMPFSLISAVYTLTALDYLGFGLPAPTPSWGELIQQGLENLSSYWLSVYPFIILFVTLLLLAFVGEGLREALDPREYSRME